MAMRNFFGQGEVFRRNNLIRLAKKKHSIVTYSNKDNRLLCISNQIYRSKDTSTRFFARKCVGNWVVSPSC